MSKFYYQIFQGKRLYLLIALAAIFFTILFCALLCSTYGVIAAITAVFFAGIVYAFLHKDREQQEMAYLLLFLILFTTCLFCASLANKGM